jgi:uncharacterized protein with PIN domain
MDMTEIFCWGCDSVLGSIPSENEKEIIEFSLNLKQKLGKCPNCGRDLWKKAEKLTKKPKAISLRFLID